MFEIIILLPMPYVLSILISVESKRHVLICYVFEASQQRLSNLDSKYAGLVNAVLAAREVYLQSYGFGRTAYYPNSATICILPAARTQKTKKTLQQKKGTS